MNLEQWPIRRYVGIAAQRLLQPWIEVQLDPASLPGGLNIFCNHNSVVSLLSLPWNVQQLQDIEHRGAIDPCRVTLRYERAELLYFIFHIDALYCLQNRFLSASVLSRFCGDLYLIWGPRVSGLVAASG